MPGVTRALQCNNHIRIDRCQRLQTPRRALQCIAFAEVRDHIVAMIGREEIQLAEVVRTGDGIIPAVTLYRHVLPAAHDRIRAARTRDLNRIRTPSDHIDCVDRKRLARLLECIIRRINQPHRPRVIRALQCKNYIIVDNRIRLDRTRRAPKRIAFAEVGDDVISVRAAEQIKLAEVTALDGIVAAAAPDRHARTAVDNEISAARPDQLLIARLIDDVIDIGNVEIIAVLLETLDRRRRAPERDRARIFRTLDIDNNVVIVDDRRLNRTGSNAKRIIRAEVCHIIAAVARAEQYHLAEAGTFNRIVAALALNRNALAAVYHVIRAARSRERHAVIPIHNRCIGIDNQHIAALLEIEIARAKQRHRARVLCALQTHRHITADCCERERFARAHLERVILAEIRDDVVAVRAREQIQFAVIVGALDRIVAGTGLDRHTLAGVGNVIRAARPDHQRVVIAVDDRIEARLQRDIRAGLYRNIIPRARQRHIAGVVRPFDPNDQIVAEMIDRLNLACSYFDRIIDAEIRNKIIAVRTPEQIQLAELRTDQRIITAVSLDCNSLAAVDDVIGSTRSFNRYAVRTVANCIGNKSSAIDFGTRNVFQSDRARAHAYDEVRAARQCPIARIVRNANRIGRAEVVNYIFAVTVHVTILPVRTRTAHGIVAGTSAQGVVIASGVNRIVARAAVNRVAERVISMKAVNYILPFAAEDRHAVIFIVDVIAIRAAVNVSH